MEKEKFTDLEHQEQRLISFLEDFEKTETDQAYRALEVARRQHKDQSRYEGTDYLIHPIRTALILLDELNLQNPDAVTATLLHDVAEDGDWELEDIEDEFGPEVARLVAGVHRPRPDDETEAEKKESKMKKLRRVARKGELIRLVALCDLLDNMRSSKLIPEDHPASQKIPRWQTELKAWLPVAKDTNEKLFTLLVQQVE